MDFQVPSQLNSNSSCSARENSNRLQVSERNSDRVTVSSVQMGSDDLIDIQRPDFFQ